MPVPADGTALFGVHLDWRTDTPASYAARSGLTPAVLGDFVFLPLTPERKQALSGRVDAARAAGAALFLTIEPGPLDTVTDAVATDLANVVAGYGARGVDVFVRFAHEMNGSWYAWGQQPQAYVAAFRRVAAAVHAVAPRAAMVWAPNYGGGYPFAGGAHAPAAGSADATAMDTDADGRLSMADDPYAPYYPGDDAVDWVALTLYHFGLDYPYGENELPEPGRVAQALHGLYDGNGQHEDQSALPDFYGTWAVGHAKPMALAETGALFNETPTAPGASALDLKSAWLEQVYGAAVRRDFPLLKMVNWFEIRKQEDEAKGVVDWRATADPTLLGLLRGHVRTGHVFGTPPAAVTPDPAPAHERPRVAVTPTTVGAGQPATVTVTGTPGATVDLQALRAPATSYTTVRTGLVLDARGRASVVVRPDRTVRLRAVDRAGALASPTTGTGGLLGVERAVTVRAARASGRTWTVSGTARPATPGTVVEVLRDGVVVTTVRVPSSGAWSARVALAPGAHVLQARTRADAYHAPSSSPVLRVRA